VNKKPGFYISSQMKKYKVKKGNVGGFGGRMHKIGSEVSESDFPIGNAKTLCEMEFIEEVKEKAKAEPKSKLEPKEKK
tara:strand:- start:147 stop:380 length:234 start_codon:yes stop_codon:yes gene_type:complete